MIEIGWLIENLWILTYIEAFFILALIPFYVKDRKTELTIVEIIIFYLFMVILSILMIIHYLILIFHYNMLEFYILAWNEMVKAFITMLIELANFFIDIWKERYNNEI